MVNKGVTYDVPLKHDPGRRREVSQATVRWALREHTSAATLARSFGAIRVGGKISMIGGLTGPATELNPGLIYARRANVQGISVGSMQMFEAMSRAIAASGIKPVIDKLFPFDEAQAAYRHMASGAHFGKIVIRVA